MPPSPSSGVGLILLFHDTPMQIALGMLATSAGISIVSLVYLELKLKEEGAEYSLERKGE